MRWICIWEKSDSNSVRIDIYPDYGYSRFPQALQMNDYVEVLNRLEYFIRSFYVLIITASPYLEVRNLTASNTILNYP
jgi:hypothetical protein